jgi:hypothetical protein
MASGGGAAALSFKGTFGKQPAVLKAAPPWSKFPASTWGSWAAVRPGERVPSNLMRVIPP